MIKKCHCKHESQDKIHGKGNRVHNACASKSGHQQEYLYVVCAHVKT